MTMPRLRRALFCSTLLLVPLLACEEGPPAGQTAPDPHPTPANKHEFISAEGEAGQSSKAGGRSASKPRGANGAESADDSGDDDAADEDLGGKSTSARTVEEGDIYRTLGPGRLLNLNPYRGLQVIDIQDITKPKVIGKLRESGSPVELYMVGTRAIVLLNDWTGYYGGRADISVDKQTGGMILSVDLTDPTHPTITDREYIDGSIMTSRMTRQGARATLYVAANDWSCRDAAATRGQCARTVVKSMEVTAPDIQPRTQLNLDGYVSALQATPEALIVARRESDPKPVDPEGDERPTRRSDRSVVNLVDITNIDGHMVEGAKIPVKGFVQNKFNLDLRGTILRVVSGSQWDGDANTNVLETFDATDRNAIRPIASCGFGAGQQLFGTLFLADRAFFVTYLRQDPFHAFAIDAQGRCEERSEFIVSGWNDFFRPVLGEKRLIGIGVNDESSDRTARTQRVAVSLYDITNLDNPTPLVSRAEVLARQSYSNASYDDKAFSVLEGAVSVPAPGNPAVIETGLVLIPFNSYGGAGETPRAGVQLFTFSESTLTRRGEINHGQPVQRTFQPAQQLTANISAEELSLFDTSNPDAPVERGRVELAPSYSDVLDYGTFLVRIRDTRSIYGGHYDPSANFTPPPAYFEVLPKDGDPESDAILAKLPIPAGSRAFRVGSLLVTISTVVRYPVKPGFDTKPVDEEDGDERSANEPTYESTIHLFDLQNPAAPVAVSELKSDRLLPAHGYGWGSYGRGCGVIDGGFYDDYSRVLPGALVLGRNLHQQESLGRYEQCETYVANHPECTYRGGAEDCTWYDGFASCSRKVGTNSTSCDREFVQCVRKEGKTTCTPTDESNVDTRRSCYTGEQHRYWQSLELDVLDVRNPAAPVLTSVPFAREEESQGIVASGSSVYFAFKKPHTVAGDERPFAKYFFREVRLSDPAKPVVGEPVNVPGQLLAVSGDKLFTRDLRWGEMTAETHLHALRRLGNVAEIAASQSFANRDVTGVLLDGADRMLVTHRDLSRQFERRFGSAGEEFGGDTPMERRLDKLAIFQTEGLARLGETDVDTWSDMTQALAGRVLFAVPGGLLVVDAQNPAAPAAQAYFPFQGYQRQVSFDGATILVAAGPYGIHKLDATTRNLLTR